MASLPTNKRTVSLLVLGTILFAVKLSQSQEEENHIPWYGLGPNECHQRETCSVGEYCSNNKVWEGCRNCTVILPWCTLDMDHVRKKFPSCEATCERELASIRSEKVANETRILTAEKADLKNIIEDQEEKLKETEKQLTSTEKALNRTLDAKAELTAKLEKEIFIWKLAFFTTVPVISVVLGLIICKFWRENKTLRKRNNAHDIPPEAATANETGQQQTDTMLQTPVQAEPPYGRQTEDADSGHGDGTTSSSGTPRSSNPSLVVPNGNRVEHQYGDATTDCMEGLGDSCV
ncbi:hypothetical protein BaRGS_00006710 [Batillaria attramentaria]|uniref:Uncharacterized protein n=1 Tax=Batillaria attramentaria TaxID=370345 RepID=A0ABD0LRZ0_9CAEN